MQLVMTKAPKNMEIKKMGLYIILITVIAVLAGCGNNSKSLQGYWKSTDEQGQVYHMEISKNTLHFLAGNQYVFMLV
ncbi:hypothetical protein A5888_002543 [Enterococcus sp. 9E7_DIV0242]|uniref:Uncharacterized protein n=1 Tax=Candidatus Enterococcus clewellii TaxID=1834193 RepID=A0AAQ3W022_9ENTE